MKYALFLYAFIATSTSLCSETLFSISKGNPQARIISTDNHLTTYIGKSKFRAPGSTELAQTYSITTSGIYVITTDVEILSQDPANSVIYINSGGVMLDLGGHVISLDSNSSTGVDGIRIAGDKKNVVVKNGIIDSMTGYGVNVEGACKNIRLKDLYIRSADEAGVGFTRSNATERSYDCLVEDCTIVDCDGGGSADAIAVYVSFCNYFITKNCIFNRSNTTGSGLDAYGLYASDSTHGRCLNCEASGNTGNYISSGFFVSSGDGWLFKNCTARYNNSGVADSNGIAHGFYATASKAFVYENCISNAHSAHQIAAGYYLQNCSYFHLIDCEGNYNNITAGSNGAYGFVTDTATNTGNLFDKCTAIGNTGSSDATSRGCGFALEDSFNSSIIQCVATANDGGTGIGIGIDLRTTCTRCCIEECKVISNSSASGSTVYGIWDEGSGTTNLITKNFSFANRDEGGSKTTTNYQLQDVATNIVQEVARTAISTVTDPTRGNVSITP